MNKIFLLKGYNPLSIAKSLTDSAAVVHGPCSYERARKAVEDSPLFIRYIEREHIIYLDFALAKLALSKNRDTYMTLRSMDLMPVEELNQIYIDMHVHERNMSSSGHYRDTAELALLSIDVRELTEKQALQIVSKCPRLIKYFPVQSDAMQIDALKKNPQSFEFFINPSFAVIKYAVQNCPGVVIPRNINLTKLTTRQAKELINIEYKMLAHADITKIPDILKFVEKNVSVMEYLDATQITREMIDNALLVCTDRTAVDRLIPRCRHLFTDDDILKLIRDQSYRLEKFQQTDERIFAALDANYGAIYYVKSPLKHHKQYAIAKNPKAIENIVRINDKLIEFYIDHWPNETQHKSLLYNKALGQKMRLFLKMKFQL